MKNLDEQDLQNDIYESTGGIVEDYSADLKNFRILGDLVLRTHSTLEGRLEELILAHLKKWKDKVNLAMMVEAYQDYGPLLKKLYFLQKLTACKEYGLISRNKKDRLRKLLVIINDVRDKFAHYQSFASRLQNDYDTPTKRENLLNNLKSRLI